MPTEKMQILLLSDTHGRLHPEILALARDSDCVVHAGDIGHPDILDALGDAGRSVVAVRGNNDTPGKWPTARQGNLEALGYQAELALPGGTLTVEHGHKVNPVARRHELLRERNPQARLILYGHSHRQLIDDMASPWVVNPGAAGRSRTYGGSGCVLLTASERRWALRAFRFPLAGWGT
jgi:putative phosphoesterase